VERREVRDGVRPSVREGRGDAVGVADVDGVDRRPCRNPLAPSPRQVIEHRDSMPGGNKTVTKMASDEAGAAGDEHVGRRQSGASISTRMICDEALRTD